MDLPTWKSREVPNLARTRSQAMRDILTDDTSGRRASGFEARSDTYLHMEYAQAAMQSLTWTSVHLAQSDLTFGRPG